VSDVEVREFTSGNPLSFLRITRPEAEVGRGGPDQPATAFARAKENLASLIDQGVLIVESEPSVYIYRLSQGEHVQTGIVACCSLDEYENGLIRKHENTRPDKVADRTDHLLTLQAQTGLILLAFRGTPEIEKLISAAAEDRPLYDFCDSNGICHTIWRVSATEGLVAAFAKVPVMYIADGHHRIESADRARKIIGRESKNGSESHDHDFVMAGIFPSEELKILAYNRSVRTLNGLSEKEFFDRLAEHFEIATTHLKQPPQRGHICMYLGNAWYDLRVKCADVEGLDPVGRLDVSLLQDLLLRPILGIDDPRTNGRIIFVGGKRGSAELERLVNTGEAKVSFSLFPTSMDDLLAVSDANEIMPPKSTWFEPKLRDGLLVHRI
jgi:uncharacterized protein (DUF1015 family)